MPRADPIRVDSPEWVKMLVQTKPGEFSVSSSERKMLQCRNEGRRRGFDHFREPMVTRMQCDPAKKPAFSVSPWSSLNDTLTRCVYTSMTGCHAVYRRSIR